MQYDFSTVADVVSFASVPEGRYLCRVAEVREGESRDGSPRWSLRLEVAEGDRAGRTAAWDSITWSERGIHRVKLVLDTLGIDTEGVVEIAPDELVGLETCVEVVLEEREDPLSGRRELRNRVPYDGYLPAERWRGLCEEGAESGGEGNGHG
ncbi:MAG: DUF669 domain-containing protein [Planctomycetota bacterium]|jgi:hypothetical protein|nr:DUF669 domain-containing protein [Planctomycetota bacterium]MDP6763005.1 DUF669 domain-containing protein [Planctomycetota bacterium]MDP6990712.1 DUF669 domain-containing protein [Planctomycetota bacterium]